MMPATIRVLALMESASVTGPAKNLIGFAGRAQAETAAGRPAVQVSIVTFLRGEEPNAFIQAARMKGIPVHILKESGRWDLGPLEQLREIVSLVKPDIIQSHNIKSHLFVRWLGLHREYPWVAFNHGYTTTDLKDRLYNQIDRWSLRAAHRVVAVCGPFAERLQQLGVRRDRIRVQHNSVEPFQPPPPEAVEAVARQLGIAKNETVILTVGRLSLEKGHADLLRAATLMKRRGTLPGCRIVLVGDGPERSNLEGMAREQGLEDAVRFAGHQSDVRPYYSLASLLVLPSYTEGSPNVVLEAMAAGVPVVATAVGGVTEILTNNETGVIVPPRDPETLARSLESLASDGFLRMRLAAAARERAAVAHTPNSQCRAIIEVYEELLQSR